MQAQSVRASAPSPPILAGCVPANGFPPVGHIIYIHHHWDHVYGACEFEATVVAHSLCKQVLTEETKKPWSVAYLHRQMEADPPLTASCTARLQAVRDWDAFHIVVPDIVFDRTMSLQLGRLNLELEHVGGQHAPDSLVVRVPQAQVMFLGDCFYPPPLHLRKPGDQADLTMLARLESKDYSLYVEGHDRPVTHAGLLKKLGRRSSVN